MMIPIRPHIPRSTCCSAAGAVARRSMPRTRRLAARDPRPDRRWYTNLAAPDLRRDSRADHLPDGRFRIGTALDHANSAKLRDRDQGSHARTVRSFRRRDGRAPRPGCGRARLERLMVRSGVLLPLAQRARTDSRVADVLSANRPDPFGDEARGELPRADGLSPADRGRVGIWLRRRRDGDLAVR